MATRFNFRRLPSAVAASLLLVAGLTTGPRPARAAEAADPAARIVSVQRLGDTAPHCAFTDLTRWRGAWWCVFREGQAHVSPDGAIRVLTSVDGTTWTSAARITSPDGDLRDPKVCPLPDGRLMIYGAVALPAGSPAKHRSLVWLSNDGAHWDAGTRVGDDNVWLWRITWNGPSALGVGYDTDGERFVRLYQTRDGVHYDTLAANWFSEPNPNEAGLAYLPDGTCLCVLRRDGQPGTGKLATGRPPYGPSDWTWKDLGVRIGGPQLLRLPDPDGRLVVAARLYDGGARTALAWLDPQAGRLTEFLRLPSGGDCSYPGLVWHAGELWVSYYSSHEGRTAVYLARVRLPAR